MKTWFASSTGAITLSFVALLIELPRAFLDFAFELPGFTGGGEGPMILAAAVYTLLFGVWIIGLFKARQSQRAGLITALAIGLLFVLGIDLDTIFFYCPGGCAFAAFDLASWLGLIVGTLAVIALGAQLRVPRTQQTGV